MRIARHDGFDVTARDADERGAQFADDRDHLAQFVTQIKAKIERDLIVARSRSVQLATRVTDFRDQPTLDREMDIFVAESEVKASRVNLTLDCVSPGSIARAL